MSANAIPTTNGLVDVPAGSTVNGVVQTVGTTVTVPATVTYPNGSTGLLNQVTTAGTTTTRTAIEITGGKGAGTIIGRVSCTPTSGSGTARSGSFVTTSCPPTSQSAGTVTNGPFIVVGAPAGVQCDSQSGTTRLRSAGIYSIEGIAYPLAVDAAGAAGASPDLGAVPSASESGGLSTTTLLVGGLFGLALLAQVAVGRKTWRRHDEVAAK